MVDHIYIVHYAPLVQRKEYLLQQFNSNSITNYEFITDYDRNTTTQEVMDKYFEFNTMTHALQRLSPTQICISISHVEIYRRIVESKHNLCLILEDDALLTNLFKEKLDHYIDNLPEDFDIGFLNDGCGFHADTINESQIWYRKPSTRTCCAYLITKKTCEKLIKTMIPFNNVIDFELVTQIKNHNLNCYWAEPTIVTDGSDKLYGSSYSR
jgi:GR25 family glycosyltransferase involved in LPS biosynthesis